MFRSAPGKQEFGFRDSWKFNLAAYHLAQLLQIDAVPATVEREHDGRAGVLHLVGRRRDHGRGGAAEDQRPRRPTSRRWEHQMATMRVFDALIANSDRNKGNLLIDKDWTTWYIDHTRAFRRSDTILDPKVLVRCERRLLAAVKALDEATVRARVSRWLDNDEIRSLFARRDAIVARFEAAPSALYTYEP